MGSKINNLTWVVLWTVAAVVATVLLLPTFRESKGGDPALNSPKGEAVGRLINRAFLHMKKRKTNPDAVVNAERLFRKAYDQSPNNPRILFGLAWAKASRKAPASDWKPLYRQAGAYAAEVAAWSYYNLALAEKNSGQYRLAIGLFQKACQFDPKDAECWYETGFCQHKLGRFGAAKLSFERSLVLDPKDGWAYYHLGRALHRLGQADAAEDAWKKAERIQPELKTELATLRRSLKPVAQPVMGPNPPERKPE